MSSKFVHLHVHSHYSLLQALPKIGELVGAAKELGMEALALTDYGAMYGAIEFYKACKKAGIKPIIGFEAYMAPHKLTDKRPRIDDRPTSLILLAENLEGYKNLMRLTTIAHLDGFYYKPRIDKETLRRHAAGVIGLSGGTKGDICRALQAGDKEKAETLAKEYVSILGEGNFFLEMQDHPELDEQRARNEDLAELSRKAGIPTVITKDVHYLRPEDAEPHDLLVCIGAGKTVDQDDRQRMTGVDYSFATAEQMIAAAAEWPEAADNTVRIAERCNLELELGKWNFPNFVIPEDKTHSQHLRQLAYEGVAAKVPEMTDDIKKRLDYELQIIDKKGFSPYFLVVSDYVRWARERGIIVTTRGSAAGSLVSYGMDIVTVNPLDFRLPFERFLNPFRPSPPDIDVDFADDRRDEVIAYVTEKYGKDKVAQIGTFGTMMARAAVRDVGRALGLPYALVDQVAKLIPFGSQGFAMTIARALDETPELKELSDNDPRVKKLLELAQKVEGCARHVSVHAAGVVIADKPLTEYMPLQREPGGDKLITQFDMHAVEDAGVLKMDFLGIRNLSILGRAVRIIHRTKGVDIDLQDLPFDDAKTFKLLAEGDTTGLFQLGGSGMTRYLKELKPSNIFDIMAMVALFRPGPMESIPEFIRRKHDPRLITYIDPRQKDILSMSYGIITYQDDVLLTAINIAGYNWEEADKLRKAMGKKIPEEMAKQEGKFRDGCIKNGLTAAKAGKLWELIKPFAAYGFNKAHAASYAVVAYQTAYLKANYPAEFMTAVLTAESGDAETVADAVAECVRMGISVLPPDVNSSGANFTFIDDKNIRFGLLAIKNLGSDIIDAVIAEREARGAYSSIADMASRIESKGFNKKSLEAMIKSGALDSLGERNQLLANIDQILAYHKNAMKDRQSGQANMFSATPLVAAAGISLRAVPPATKREKLHWEKELLGLYVSEHPFKEFADYYAGLLTETGTLAAKKPLRGLVRVGGVITHVRQITTKSNEPMAFARLEDTSGAIEAVVFPSVFRECGAVMVQDAAVMVEGRYSEKDGEGKILCEKATPLTPETAEKVRSQLSGAYSGPGGRAASGSGRSVVSESAQVRIAVPTKMTNTFANELKRVLSAYPGGRKVVLLVKDGDGIKKIETGYAIEFSSESIGAIEGVLGRGAVQS